jgi:predicted component of type VI protein secretion system
MITAMIYDTLKLAEKLETEAGFDAPRAKAMARILAENAGGNLATREDILVVKGELQAEIQHLGTRLRDEIQRVNAGLRDQIQRVSTGLAGEIHAVNTSLRDENQRVSTGLAGEIHAVNTSLRDEIQRVSTGLREEIQDLRGDVRVLYWITGTTFAGVAGLLSIAIAMALHVMHMG